MLLRSLKMETCKLLGCWIMTRGWNILSLLIPRLIHLQVHYGDIVLFLLSFRTKIMLNDVVYPSFRWNVHLWVLAWTSLLYIPGHHQGWSYAWSCANNNTRVCNDAWLCNHRELFHIYGPAFVVSTKGTRCFMHAINWQAMSSMINAFSTFFSCTISFHPVEGCPTQMHMG